MRDSATRLGHWPSLDGMRGLSILAVMAFHAGSGVIIGTVLLLAAMGLFCSNHAGYMYRGGYTVFAVAVGVSIALLLGPAPKLMKVLLETPVLVWIGRLSYGLYLWHIPLYAFCYGRVQHYPLIVRLAVEFGLTFVAASLSYYFIEKLFLRLKHRFIAIKPASDAAMQMTA